ncbi:MAG: TonB-dependent receptor [Acidobacteria bacterium]|nr:TonB-dependent receptor [Acidobacteriota bacterium]
MTRNLLLPIFFGILILAVSPQGNTQTATARLSGVVTDESEGVLAGAQVTVMNVETGLRRVVVTDDRGRYNAPQLPPGPYELTVTMTGFDTLVRRGVTLALGQEATLAVSLKIGAVTEQVTVSAEAPVVNTTSGSVAGLVDEKRIAELPLNGRDFTQLALVQPGIYLARKTDSVGTKGFGTRISMAGSRVDQTAWLLDGSNIKGAATFGVPGSASGLVLGVDAVREFQVLTSNYSAEFGGTSGGIVNMVTKSGTNEFHGTVYEFLRNDNLDARGFFDRRKLEFKRNQFGFSLGGPIKKQKAFFFGNYEGLRERLGQTNIAFVPDASIHQGSAAPSTRPYLDLFPLPNGKPVGPGIGELITPVSQPTNQNYFVTRVDYQLNDNQTLFGRFTFDEGDRITPDTLPVTSVNPLTRARYATLQHQYIITPRLLAATRVAFNRTILASDVQLNISFPANLFIFNPNYPPTISFPEATPMADNLQNVFSNVHNLYQVSEDMVFTRGSHSMKFGFDFQHVGMNINGGSRDFGEFGWASMQDFLQDRPTETFAVGAPGSSAIRSLRQNFFGAYYQDDWRLRSNLTVNLGVRYEPYGLPTEKWGRLSQIRDWRTSTELRNDFGFFTNPSRKHFSPRVGFAWSPGGSGKTAVRGGFGLFFVPAYVSMWRTQTYRNSPYYGLISLSGGRGTPNLAGSVAYRNQVGPTILSSLTSSNTFLQLPDYHINSSYEMKANLTIEREFSGGVSVALGYLGSRAIHLWRLTSCNTRPVTVVNGREFVDPSGARPNRDLGGCAINYSDAQAFYNAMQVEIKKRFSGGFQFQTSYTWSKNIDDSTTGGVNTDYLEGSGSRPYNKLADRGLSALHVGHNFVANSLYAFPSPQGSSVARAILGGWQISGILSAATGIPFSARISGFNAQDLHRSAGSQYPDLTLGRSNENIVNGTTAGCSTGPVSFAAGEKLGTPDRYFDPCAFFLPPAGFYGNAGRNILIGPGLLKVDFSLMKHFSMPITEGSRLEFRADFFNLFNRPNFGTPSIQVLNGSNGRYITTAGRITNTTTTGRQLQFGLKLTF